MTFYFTVKTATVNGTDLDIVVNENIGISTSAFTGSVSFPLILRRENYSNISPDLPASIFNIEDLSWKRMLYKHGGWIRSVSLHAWIAKTGVPYC